MREVIPRARSAEAESAPASGEPPFDLCLRSSYSLRSRSDLPESAYLRVVEAGELRRLWFERLSLSSDVVVDVHELGGTVVFSRRSDAGEVTLLRFPDETVALLDRARGMATIEVAGCTVDAVDRRKENLAELLGVSDPPAGEVPVTFWAGGQGMSRSARRRIKAPSWHEIRVNYASTTAAAVAELATLAHADVPKTGRLILWHGLPGTGKTTALRALARAWEPWCSTHFVTDPEACLGSNTSYLLDVLMSESSARDRTTPGWKLIVLEDSGELLTADAHARTGQGLSRLLNITDGVIGQGMQVIVLVTTNEPLGRLHPAVQRPGRCWSQVEFKSLGTAAANDWLESHGCSERCTGPAAVADLYALLRGHEVRPTRVVGFAA